MNSTPLQIAVVGLGLIGKKHIECIQNNPRTNLTSIVGPATPENQFVAREVGLPLQESMDKLWQLPQLDGVIIASPNIFHVDQALDCLAHNIPVLVEKPVAHSLDEGERLVKAALMQNGKVLVGHHRTYSPIIQTARAIVQSGELGKLVAIKGSATFYKPDSYFKDGPWRTEKGGGPILINLIHEIGNYRTLCGEITTVQAMASNSTRHHAVEDTVAINFQFSNGCLGTFLLSDSCASAQSWEQTSGENPAYPYYPEENCYEISGTMGTLSIPTMRLRFFKDSKNQSWWNRFEEKIIPIERQDPINNQLNHFIDVIQNIEQPRVSALDGLQNLRIVQAIEQAIHSGCAVHL